MNDTKSFGRLSAAQFAELIQYVPQLLKMIQDLREHMSKLPATRFDEAMKGDYGKYCHIYETPFAQHLVAVASAMDLHDEVHAMARSSAPQDAVLGVLRNLDKVEDDGPLQNAFDRSGSLALIYALGRTVTSIATYGRSISALIEDVREQGDQDALFKAVRIDRCVIGCPSVMQLIARAQLRDNKAFFNRLRAALNGPSKREWAALHPMRYAFILLNEMGQRSLSDDELETLMVDILKVYPKVPTARKNLRAQYQQFRKYKTI